MRGVEDLDDDIKVVDTSRDPVDRLKSRTFALVDGSEGTPRWIMALVLIFFFAETMVVLDKRVLALTRGFYIIYVEYRWFDIVI